MLLNVEELYNQQTQIEGQLANALEFAADWFARAEILKTITACTIAREALVELGKAQMGGQVALKKVKVA